MTETGSSTDTFDVSRLTELLEQQVRLFEDLAALTVRQTRLVNDGEAESLLGLLAQRQELIDRLESVNGELEPYRSRWPQLWPDLDESDKQRIGPLVQQAQQLLEQIMQSDDRDRKLLEAAKPQVAAELERLSHTRAARRSYQGAGSPADSNRFTNQHG